MFRLKSCKTVSNSSPNLGGSVTFTITASNLGISNEPNAVVTDILPTGYALVSATPSVGIFNSATGVWTIGAFANGANANLVIVATVKLTGSYANTATITGNNTDPNLSNNTSTSTPIPVNTLIVAQNDTFAPTNGTTGNSNIGNALNNNGNGIDTLNGVQATITTVNIAITSPAISIGGAPVPVLNTITGVVSVPIGTPAGTYTINYTICEKINPTNCDPATITVPVSAALIDAVNDNGTPIVGATGGQSFPNVLVNDTLNANPATLATVNLTQVSTTNAGVTLNPIDGSVNVAPGTASGSYVVTYQICEKLNPTNCDSATVTVVVNNANIDAVNDNGTPIVGATGGQSLPNVLVNDTLNANPATLATVNLTQVST
ncbi:MAG: DUF11 domain-containing protein, partial [Flavobacteriaceae bacterium]|nr:DUF11 domain-containing protein [Flavobacteriaceae bacterium]